MRQKLVRLRGLLNRSKALNFIVKSILELPVYQRSYQHLPDASGDLGGDNGVGSMPGQRRCGYC